MKTHVIRVNNKPDTPITLLTNWDLVFCIPVFILNCIYYLFLRVIVLRVFQLISRPYTWLLGKQEAQSRYTFTAALLANMLALPVLLCLESYFATWNTIGFAVAAFLYLSLSAGVINTLNSLRTPSFETLSRFIAEEADTIPDHLVDTNLSNYSKYINLVWTCYIFYHVICLILMPANSWLSWLVMATVTYMIMFMDRETIEHFASHTGDGRLFKYKNASSIRDWLLVGLEYIRIYLVWPLTFWMPDYYYCSHTRIHHVENNSPKDFQSTLRFDHTSFIDFIKAVTWYSLFIMIIPVDAVRYFIANNRKRILKRFLTGYAIGFAVLAGIFMTIPVFGLLMLTISLFVGIENYSFLVRWHGFHDATQPYSLEASNNSPLHYGHHKRMSINLSQANVLGRIFWMDREKNPSRFPVFRNQQALSAFENYWLIFYAMLWQNKLGVINKFIYTDAKTNGELKKYVVGVDLYKKSKKMKQFDRKLSHRVGQFVEKLLIHQLSPEAKQLFDVREKAEEITIRHTNFASTDPETSTYRGLY